MIQILKAGFVPFAMQYKDDDGNVSPGWEDFQRLYSRPPLIYGKHREFFK